MALTPDERDKYRLIRQLRAEQAQNRTDLQRLWQIHERLIKHPEFKNFNVTASGV